LITLIFAADPRDLAGLEDRSHGRRGGEAGADSVDP
jgi:hypothetical protein